MKIKTITCYRYNTNEAIFGLGDDEKVYFWDYKKGEWKIYAYVAGDSR